MTVEDLGWWDSGLTAVRALRDLHGAEPRERATLYGSRYRVAGPPCGSGSSPTGGTGLAQRSTGNHSRKWRGWSGEPSDPKAILAKWRTTPCRRCDSSGP